MTSKPRRIELEDQKEQFQCPRCNAEVVKSNLNSHMEKADGLQKFNQLIERSLRPDMVSSSTEKLDKSGQVDNSTLDLALQ